MNEREKFEKWYAETGSMFVDMEAYWWECWQAALSTRKPYGYGIVDKDGEPCCDCATEDEESLRQEYDTAYPKLAPFRVVELFYEDSEP